MSHRNSKTVRRFFDEVLSQGRLDVADELLAQDHIHHLGEDELRGPSAVKELVQGLRAAFPDLQLVIEDEVADSDKVAVRWTAHGTHRSEFNGVQATGRRVGYGGMDLVHLRDGRIVELWAYADGEALMEQLAR
jgi:steroid delta-isomerase-like uncharacterized protein